MGSDTGDGYRGSGWKLEIIVILSTRIIRSSRTSSKIPQHEGQPVQLISTQITVFKEVFKRMVEGKGTIR